ncbi:OsmC family protein [Actinotalea sp. JY-7885]|uniref:OsmC family protein n=1 Tax=Actinotalea sp. JY-7885 TaxID=2758576 RepID=UPI00165DD0B1|nr:OsmC family protein [Actinotalea sp. JY-7885]
MGILHTYGATVRWSGAGEAGTSSYTAYSRDHEIHAEGRPPLLGSSDPAFRGDPERWNPEQLLVAALAQCHMLWFLHLAARAGVVVVGYVDEPVGTMRVEAAGAGQFTTVVLRPRVTVRATRPVDDAELAALHRGAGEHCFISRSVNFPVRTEPVPLAVEPSVLR